MRKASRARRLSMTSLIDVIFLLLMFFMLSSTFTRFAEIDLAAAGSGSVATEPPVFLRLSPDTVDVNGEGTPLPALPDRMGALAAEGAPVLVAMTGAVTAQRLTDLLAALRAVPGLRVTVLGAS